MNQLKYIIRILISLLTRAEETWRYLDVTTSDEAKPDYQQHNFHYPLLGFMSLCILTFGGLYAAGEETSFDLQHGMTGMVPVLVAYFIGPYLSLAVVKWVLSWSLFEKVNIEKEKLTLFVFYVTGFLMAMEIAVALVPSIQFVKLFRIYIVYITLTGAVNYLHVDPTKEWVFGFLSAFIIFICPTVIIWMLTTLQG